MNQIRLSESTLGPGKRVLLLMLLLLLSALLLVTWLGRGSLAVIEGELTVPNLTETVTIERDRQGIPTISSADRRATAYGLGFVHAQERFFQMDLLRRNSAGELSQLIGKSTLDHDRRIRVHRFRSRAQRNIASAPAAHLAVLEAYAHGVNAGLSQLDRKPFEYFLLGSEPQAWQPEDSLLVLFSMYMTLQDQFAETELHDSLMAEVLPADLYAFLHPGGGSWDAPLLGDAFEPAGIPSSGVTDILGAKSLVYQPLRDSDDRTIGSNNWAVGGALTEHGAAMVADDMHLNIQVPNIWYRARWPLANGLVMTGASLPGTPAMIVGSNSKVAWGFTNTGGDWSDVVVLEVDAQEQRYRVPEGWVAFNEVEETLQVKGRQPEVLMVKDTRWGPIIGRDHQGRLLALRWVAHDPEGANMNIIGMENVFSVAEAMRVASSFGQPAQNFVGGDVQGNIGWTVAGPIPRRVGLAGNRPRSWADDVAGWQGYLDYDEAPKVYNPPSHRIWTANARTLSGEYLQLMGDGGYALGARQQQIRDALFAREQFTEQDLLAIQLDDRALFLQRWQQHLRALLSSKNAAEVPLRQPREVLLRELDNWGGRASADSVGYRLVRNFRHKVIEYSIAPFVTALLQKDPTFDSHFIKRSIEYPVWTMIKRQPQHLLSPDFDSWQALQLAALNDVLEKMAADGQPLAEQTWGAENRADIVHPLVKAVPALKPWLSMPAEPLSGDAHMPRVQKPDNGASERMVVAPGHEQRGIFHMATGQSGHPWSRWFDDGHRDWVEGNPSAFLPAASRYQLRLMPE